jgi:glucose/arabinose dehydrogenase
VTRTPTRLAAALVVLVAIGCSSPRSSSSDHDGTQASTGPTSSAPRHGRVEVRLARVATLDQPLALAVRPGDPTLYVAEKTGRVVAIRDGHVEQRPVLDLSTQVSLGSEQGLLGLVFSPDGRFMYVNFTDVNGDTRIDEFRMVDGRPAQASRREVLFVDQPYSNHNGGDLVFGPDGDLYIGLGDGGSGGDPHGNGQSLSTLLGKMLRISPRPSGGDPYGIPPDNPLVGRPNARPEIWAYGLRNPWRYSFDRSTGDLWVGDVGQSAWEEIDLQPADAGGGENYGWNALEGSHRFAGDAPPGSTLPVYEYSHDRGGCVVMGGYVYRGSAIPALRGVYVFADFCLGRLEGLRVRHGRVVDRIQLGQEVQGVTSFGEDASGELYVMSIEGGLFRVEPATLG